MTCVTLLRATMIPSHSVRTLFGSLEVNGSPEAKGSPQENSGWEANGTSEENNSWERNGGSQGEW